MTNKYKEHKFKVDDIVIRLVNIEREGKIVVSQDIEGETDDAIFGVDFGEGFEGDDLDGYIESNTGLWMYHFDMWHSNERTTKEIRKLVYYFFATRSPNAFKLLRNLYYAYINENKAMCGRFIKSFKGQYMNIFKNNNIEETFKW